MRPACGSGFEVGQGLDLELVVKGPDLLGAQARDAQHGEHPGGDLFQKLVVFGEGTAGDQLRDLLKHRFANAGDIFERAVGDHLGEVVRQPTEGLRRVVIGATAEGIDPLDFEHDAHLFQNVGDPRGFHGLGDSERGPGPGLDWNGFASNRPYEFGWQVSSGQSPQGPKSSTNPGEYQTIYRQGIEKCHELVKG